MKMKKNSPPVSKVNKESRAFKDQLGLQEKRESVALPDPVALKEFRGLRVKIEVLSGRKGHREL
jgi:hypothetical protein